MLYVLNFVIPRFHKIYPASTLLTTIIQGDIECVIWHVEIGLHGSLQWLQFDEGPPLQQGPRLHREGARDTLPPWPSATSYSIPRASGSMILNTIVS